MLVFGCVVFVVSHGSLVPLCGLFVAAFRLLSSCGMWAVDRWALGVG